MYEVGTKIEVEELNGEDLNEAVKSTSSSCKKDDADEEESLSGPIFSPKLSLQRYSKVAEIIKSANVKKVVDFGCSQCNLMRYLYSIEHIEEISAVDVDLEVLSLNKHKIQPRIQHYVCKRAEPLSVKLYNGDATQYDERLGDYDGATLIEMIEHLEPDVLQKLPATLFGKINPKVVVVTTPNSEYNILFPNFSGFRHWDHKFEWTRTEFENWCKQIAEDYDYSVTYDGVGLPTEGNEHVGMCTQIATFVRNCDKRDTEEKQTPYQLIDESQFPTIEKRSLEEEFSLEAQYRLRIVSADYVEDLDDTQMVDIPINRLWIYSKFVNLCNDDISKFRSLLRETGYELTEDGNTVRYLREGCEESGSDNSEWDNYCPDTGSDCSDPAKGQFSDAEDDTTHPAPTSHLGCANVPDTWNYLHHSASDWDSWD